MSPKARVRLLLNDLQPYGAQRVAMTLASGLRDLGHAPELVLWDDAAAGGSPEWEGLPIQRMPRGQGGVPGFARQVAYLARLMHRDPTPLLSLLTYSNLLAATAAALARSSAPLVLSEHNLTTIAMANVDQRAKLKFAAMRGLYPRATAVVGVSRDVTLDLKQLLDRPEADVVTIMNPVDVERVRRAARGPVPHRWLRDPDTQTLVCPGALRAAKGQERLLRALGDLPGMHAIFVGSGDRMNHLVAEATSLGVRERVDFVGWQDNPYPWMRASDAVVIPSRWEGFGLVAVEAAATGVPVVGSNCAGLGEVLGLIGGRTVRQDDEHEDRAFAARLVTEVRAALTAPRPTYALGFFEPLDVAGRYADLLGL